MKFADLFKRLLPHLVSVVAFLAITLTYMSPVLEGYQLRQGDIEKHKAMGHEIQSHQEKYDERALWSGNMFAGMPTYMTTTVRFSGNVVGFLKKAVTLWLPSPAAFLFAYLIGFYILLLCLRVNPWLSIVGAIAFAFSSYFIVIIEAGHTSKAMAIAFMGPIVGGFYQVFRGDWKVGALLIALFTAIQLYVNHLQITYYLFFILLAIGIAELVHAIRTKSYQPFLRAVTISLLAAFLGILPNLGNLLIAFEYSEVSTRGKSELTINAQGETNAFNKSSGLDKDYITQWSNGIDETFTLVVANAKGGASIPILADADQWNEIQKEDPTFAQILYSEYSGQYRNAVSSYFGNQPIVSGPVYIGAIIVFLAFLALLVIRDRFVIALAVVTILTIMLSWGKNWMGLTEFFIDNVPGYNKFRAVAMILVVAEFTAPLLAILFLDRLIKAKDEVLKQQKKILILSGVFVGFLALIALSPSTFIDMTSEREEAAFASRMQGDVAASDEALNVRSQIISYREGVVASSAFSSLRFVLLALVLLILFAKGKIKSQWMIAGIGALVLIDLWVLDKQYVNNEKVAGGSARAGNKYAMWQKVERIQVPYEPNGVDNAIFNKEVAANPQIAAAIEATTAKVRKESKGRVDPRKMIDIRFSELMEGTHYRVLDAANRLDQDVRTPYFHKTLGGYHGAKMKRYQEVIDFHLVYEHYQVGQGFAQGGSAYVQQLMPAMKISNMLNVKYVFGRDNQQQLALVENQNALGNAWFVDAYQVVPSADSAILSMRNFAPAQTLIVEQKDAQQLNGKQFRKDPNASIQLTKYGPNELSYQYKASSEQLAIFSEIYYASGWKAYLNGQEVPHFRANYILRAMVLPSGQGELVFKFEPSAYQLGGVLSWVSSVLLILLGAFVIYSELKPKKAATA